MKLYKLTNHANRTNGSWELYANRVLRLPKKENPQLCMEDVIHAYKNPNLAYLLNPVHGDYHLPKIWRAEGEVVVEDFGRVGCFELRVIRELERPKWVDSEQEKLVQVQFAILCAEAALQCFEEKHQGDTRPRKAIKAARAHITRGGNAYDVVDAADNASGAVYAARDDVDAAYVAYAALCAAKAAYAAVPPARDAYRVAIWANAYISCDAARLAADAARSAARAVKVDFCKLADRAVESIEGVLN